MEYISVICWILASVCSAVMDTLQHHYPISIFAKHDPQFWDPAISWKNKYREGMKVNGPAFYLSTGLLVAFTDGWHLFKSMQIVLLGLAMVTLSYSLHIEIFERLWLNQGLELGLLGVLWNVPFSYMYHRILIK